MKHITSRHNSLVTRCREVMHGDDRTRILLDGVHLVAEAIAAGMTLQEAVVVQSAIDAPDIRTLVTQLVSTGVDVVSASPAVMSALSPVRSSSPIVALATRRSVSEHELFRARAPMIVGAVDVQQPGNVGAITRVAEAGGATGVAVTGHSADPFGWKALRGSMGSAFRLPLITQTDTARLVETARQRGCRIIASVPRGGRSPGETSLDGAVLLLVGGEGAGLPSGIVDAADERITIPMAAPVESLNTAVCAALLVYEARRQRLARSSHGLALSRRS
jgi:RNA methyltransferase, TrmH family